MTQATRHNLLYFSRFIRHMLHDQIHFCIKEVFFILKAELSLGYVYEANVTQK